MQEVCPVCGSKELKNVDNKKYKCLACDEVFSFQNETDKGLTAKDIYNQSIDSIVEVSCVFDEEDSIGTGFCISEEGLFITNAHVLVDTSGVKPKLSESISICKSKSIDFIDAKVLHIDFKTDLALLKVFSKNKYKPVKFANKLEIGDKVVVVGNSEGQGLLLLDGLVGDINRKYKEADAFIYNSLVANGCSGGPIFNIKGELCGVVAASSKKTQGLNYGIALQTVNSFIESAKK